ncbi:MAG: sulfatase [Planctomycetaceae bacterium]|nr:sulfatase [Planctomycetaceae bacterium]
MRGGPSQMETFDYKPRLNADDGKPSKNKNQKYFGSQWAFQQYGKSGLWVSDLLPKIAQHTDKLCVLNGMYCDSDEHAAALTQLHTGSIQFHRPSIGSWVLYGLGSESKNLPGFVSIKPPVILGGERIYSSAFLPSVYQGTPIGTMSQSITKATVENLTHPSLSQDGQADQLHLIQNLNRRRLKQTPADQKIDSIIQSYELAFRMQSAMPEVMDLTKETKTTLDQYGIGDKLRTNDFGRQCLLARRFAEAGVRFIELTHDNWDHHGGVVKNMPVRCEQIDQPIAGLLRDLDERGLLDDTLIVWGGEFGRTPDDPRGDGRGHNNNGFTMWLAGGGVQSGISYGSTDEYSYEAVDGRVHVHDLHATILHLLGLDHERLTYHYAGRDFRLTDVPGRVVSEIL